jgi:serine/threonine-protein kinase HipA
MNENKGSVYYNDILAGYITKENGKYYFTYTDEYIASAQSPSISLTLPKIKRSFVSNNLFPFFFGLLAEGDNKKLQCKTLKIDEKDHFTRLLKTAGRDTIGGITIK